jgi:hypothetical protein
MEDNFVPYEIALSLKEIGFNEGCLTYYFIGGKMSNYFKKVHINSGLIQQKPYNFHCTSPLYQQAFNYILKSYLNNYSIEIFSDDRIRIFDNNNSSTDFINKDNCLKKLIEIAKKEIKTENFLRN